MPRSAVANRFVPRTFNFALKGNGSNSIATAADHADYAFGTGAFTFEGWFKWDKFTVGDFYHLIGKRGAGGSWGRLYLTSGTGLVFEINAAVITSFVIIPLVGRWYHIVGTRSAGGSCQLYVDGVAVGTPAVNTGIINNTAPFELFSYDTTATNNDFPGFLTHCRVYNRALSATEVSDRYFQGRDDTAMRTGLVSEWKMTEGSGTTAADNSGLGHTLTLTNVTWSSDTPPMNTRSTVSNRRVTRNYGFAVSASSAAAQGVSGGTTISAIGTGTCTIELWVKVPVQPPSTIFSLGGLHDGTGVPLFTLGSDGLNLTVYFRTGTGTSSSINVAVFSPGFAGQWVQIHVVLNGAGRILVYRNGAVLSDTAQAYNLTTAGNIYAFEVPGWQAALINAVDGELRVWTRALNAIEVSDRYFRNIDDSAMRTSLAAQYVFSEGIGTSVADGSGNSRTMTININVAWTTDSPMKSRVTP